MAKAKRTAVAQHDASTRRPRTIHLPAIDRTVTLGQYLQAVKMAKSNPDEEFKHGLSSWWPTKGSEIVRQFNDGLRDRINAAVPYYARGTGKPFTKLGSWWQSRA